jgi:hypothetical protein
MRLEKRKNECLDRRVSLARRLLHALLIIAAATDWGESRVDISKLNHVCP